MEINLLLRFLAKLSILNETIHNANNYKVGQTIPDWTKYKFHSIRLCITNIASGAISDMQISLFGINCIIYNNNSIRDGGFGFEIDISGKINIGGNSSTVPHSYVTDIYMWN